MPTNLWDLHDMYVLSICIATEHSENLAMSMAMAVGVADIP